MLHVKFFISDWRSGVSRLTAIERALYHEVCMEVWETGQGPLVEDIPRLLLEPEADILNAYKHLKRLGKLLERDGRASNERALREYQQAVDLRDKQSDGGKKAAVTRRARQHYADRPMSAGERHKRGMEVAQKVIAETQAEENMFGKD